MRAFPIALTMLAMLGSTLTPLNAEDTWQIDNRNRDILIRHLQVPLDSAGGYGRFYYGGPCTRGGPSPAFPRLNLQNATKGAIGVAAVRQVFRNDRRVSVTQSRSGMVRISVGNPPSAILQTKIRSLRFKPEERYTPELALIAIEGARDVEAAMKKFRVEHPVVVASIGIQYPMAGRPHLPASLTDLTLDEALDAVAKTFGGVVTYEHCTTPDGRGFFSTDFFCIACR